MIHYNLYDSNVANSHAWTLGQPIQNLNEYGRCCVDLTASGRELELIREQFQFIPMTRADEVRWTGDTAAFIAMNLKS